MADVDLDDILARLVAALGHAVVPVHVRQSAVAQPPWNAEPIAYSVSTDIVAAGVPAPERWGVRWTPAPDSTAANVASNAHIVRADSWLNGIADVTLEPFPKGYVGVVFASCHVSQIVTAAAAELPKQTRWTLEKNGTPVPGYQRQLPASHTGALLVGAPNAYAFNEATMRCPVLLRGGDTMSAVFDTTVIGGGANINFQLRITGWRWPTGIYDPTTIRGVYSGA